MTVLLWILAVLSLFGGVGNSFDDENIMWLFAGIFSFAVLGGFASIVSLLKKMSSNLSEVKSELAQLRQEKSASQLDGSAPSEQIAEEEQHVEVPSKKEEAIQQAATEETSITSEGQQRNEGKPRYLDEECRNTIKYELRSAIYAAKSSSSSSAKKILEDLYTKTEFAPLREILELPDYQIPSATEELLKTL